MQSRMKSLVAAVSLVASASCGGSTRAADAGSPFADVATHSSSSASSIQQGSSSSNSGTAPLQCPGTTLPTTLTLDLSGFVTCTCFNGTFTLDLQSTGSGSSEETVWSSTPITGCPGQQEAVYLKLLADSNGLDFGLTGEGSVPGSGDSDDSPSSTYTCSPFTAKGGASQAGNITGFCSGATEDGAMMWSIGTVDAGTSGSK